MVDCTYNWVASGTIVQLNKVGIVVVDALGALRVGLSGAYCAIVVALDAVLAGLAVERAAGTTFHALASGLYIEIARVAAQTGGGRLLNALAVNIVACTLLELDANPTDGFIPRD